MTDNLLNSLFTNDRQLCDPKDCPRRLYLWSCLRLISKILVLLFVIGELRLLPGKDKKRRAKAKEKDKEWKSWQREEGKSGR